EEIQQEILDYYLAQAKLYRSLAFSRDEFYEIFRVQMLQRCFKACGSFASFYNTREDTRYLKYLTPTLGKISAALESFPAYRAFQSILIDHGLLEFNYLNPNEIK